MKPNVRGKIFEPSSPQKLTLGTPRNGPKSLSPRDILPGAYFSIPAHFRSSRPTFSMRCSLASSRIFLRLGMPRWLSATHSFGILLLLWFCSQKFAPIA